LRIAIVGGGIAGLYTAHCLAPLADIQVFEAGSHPGGHSNTVEVAMDGQRLAIDTGFIVYNERNYPHFSALLKSLGVATQPSDMSFSFRCSARGLEYRGDNTFDAIFAQRRNLLRPSFLRMIAGILRFNRLADALVASPPDRTLGDFLAQHGFAGPVVDDYLLPMAGAIWSVEPGKILEFPARHFGEFCQNHGLLQVEGRPQWRTVTGGSREYVRALVRPFRDRVHVGTPVERIERHPGHVVVKARGRAAQHFDQVVLACHSDQALALLADATPAEREVLGAIGWQDNDVVLHTDTRLLPRRRRAWASWNYHRDPHGPGDRVSVTYNLTHLQSLPTRRQFLVTLNRGELVDPATVIHRETYAHPVYTAPSMRARARQGEINGPNRTYFCGAYWGFGFHEDGVRSALAVYDALRAHAAPALPARPGVAATASSDEQLYLSGTG
jgi:predicted NAD/FAD-binding protein